MNWEEAKQSTLELWRAIHASVGVADPVRLLTEINGVGDLCALAREEADSAHDVMKCHYCPAYEQFGGCREVSAQLSELVARGEWPALKAEIAGFIRRLETMEAPGPLQIVH